MIKGKSARAPGIGEAALLALAGALLVALFHRNFPLTSGDRLPGDPGDVRFIIAILEHWWEVVRGHVHWRSPMMFHPMRGTLGYSDALFLLTPPYVAARAFGMDMYAAFQATMMAMSALGCAASIWLFRRIMGVPPLVTVVGAALFMFSNGQFLATNHPQFSALAYLPLLAGAVLVYVRRVDEPAIRRLGPGVAFAALFGLLAFTSFYVAWFAGLFLLVCAPVALIEAGARNGFRPTIATLGRWLRANHRHLAALAVIQVVFLTPFLVTYVPILRQVPGRRFADVAPMLPMAADYVNVSYYNWLWGGALRTWLPWLDTRPFFTELRHALTPIATLTLIATVVVALYVRLTDRATAPRLPSTHTDAARWCGPGADPLVLVIGGTTLACLALMLRVGENTSLWRLVFDVVPGASGLRSPFRLNLVLGLPLAMVVGIALARMTAPARPWATRGLGIALLVLLLVEQWNTHPPGFSKAEERARIARVLAPPPECQVFFLLPEEGRKVDQAWLQIDAMLFSFSFDRPTLNGYSGWFPPGWEMRDPAAPGYQAAVKGWVEGNHIDPGTVCRLEGGTGRWSVGLTDPPPPPPKPVPYPWRG